MYDLPQQLTYFRGAADDVQEEPADILANSSAPRDAQRPQVHDVDDDPTPLDGLDIHCKD